MPMGPYSHHHHMWMCTSMKGESLPLITNEPVEFKKQTFEVQDCKKFTNHFRGICKIYQKSIKEN